MFSCEYFEIFNNIYFEKHLRTTASVNPRPAVFQESLALPFKRLNFSNFVVTHAFQSGWHLFAFLTVALFLKTQSVMLGFWFILVASIVVTWPSSFSRHMFKMEAEDFGFHILQRNLPNFGEKILVLCSAKSLRSFSFSLFCSQLIYTCSKFG